MTAAVDLVVREVTLGVRPVTLRLPFRFGSNTLTSCPQLFVRVQVEVSGRGRFRGDAAELMVPKWFDKRPGQSAQDNVEQLAGAVRAAGEAYLNDRPATAFGLSMRHHEALMQQGGRAGATELTTAFGAAVLDKAVADALCRGLGVSFFDAARHTLLGLCDAAAAGDMAGWDWAGWLASLRPLRRIEARHTVGLLDELDAVRCGEDELPVSLRAVVQRYAQHCFKIKLGGDPGADLRRLRAVLAVLDEAAAPYRYTLDGNEQYAGPEALQALIDGLQGLQAPLYIEQPVSRERSLLEPLPAPLSIPLLLDEADAGLASFAQGRRLGWTGVSSKSCKGMYKAMINRARCERWNREEATPGRYFMSAEDLTCQAGLAVQQDLALAALLGIPHAERNGHHYGRGFGDAPVDEQRAFVEAHPDLYDWHDGRALLRIVQGKIEIDSLFATGYAHRAQPDWHAIQAL